LSGPARQAPAPAAEKRKRVRTPAVKRDPVIAALIAKLPGEAATFTREQRINWLRQMAMAMDGAYGVDAAIAIDDAPGLTISAIPARAVSMTHPTAPPQPVTAPADSDEIRFYVDASGYARQDPGGKRIDPFDIPDGSELEDEREGDDALDTINWKAGQFPPAAYPDRQFVILKARA